MTLRSSNLSAPIVFIHYGDARFLRWTLWAARRSNPDKRVVLLGDASNCRIARGLADFLEFESLAGGEKEGRFHEVFQVIQGDRHRFNKANGVEYWLKFVFRRWFLIEEFLRRGNVDAFWTFDSDTLVLTDLASREGLFTTVEATTQCRGMCLNGWVGSRDLVSRYTECILRLFCEPAYLADQRTRLKTHSGLAFNEMDAFDEFRRREGVLTRRASDLIGGETFDDALAFVEDYEVGPEKVLGKTAIKRLWTDGSSIFAKANASREFVRLLTCNMSWMPDFLWKRILANTRQDGGANRLRAEDFREISVKEPIADRILRNAKMATFRMRRAFGLSQSIFQQALPLCGNQRETEKDWPRRGTTRHEK